MYALCGCTGHYSGTRQNVQIHVTLGLSAKCGVDLFRSKLSFISPPHILFLQASGIYLWTNRGYWNTYIEQRCYYRYIVTKFFDVQKVSIERYSNVNYDWQQDVLVLKRRNYVVLSNVSIGGDAPKEFIKVYEYGRVKRHPSIYIQNAN